MSGIVPQTYTPPKKDSEGRDLSALCGVGPRDSPVEACQGQCSYFSALVGVACHLVCSSLFLTRTSGGLTANAIAQKFNIRRRYAQVYLKHLRDCHGVVENRDSAGNFFLPVFLNPFSSLDVDYLIGSMGLLPDLQKAAQLYHQNDLVGASILIKNFAAFVVTLPAYSQTSSRPVFERYIKQSCVTLVIANSVLYDQATVEQPSDDGVIHLCRNVRWFKMLVVLFLSGMLPAAEAATQNVSHVMDWLRQHVPNFTTTVNDTIDEIFPKRAFSFQLFNLGMNQRIVEFNGNKICLQDDHVYDRAVLCDFATRRTLGMYTYLELLLHYVTELFFILYNWSPIYYTVHAFSYVWIIFVWVLTAILPFAITMYVIWKLFWLYKRYRISVQNRIDAAYLREERELAEAGSRQRIRDVMKIVNEMDIDDVDAIVNVCNRHAVNPDTIISKLRRKIAAKAAEKERDEKMEARRIEKIKQRILGTDVEPDLTPEVRNPENLAPLPPMGTIVRFVDEGGIYAVGSVIQKGDVIKIQTSGHCMEPIVKAPKRVLQFITPINDPDVNYAYDRLTVENFAITDRTFTGTFGTATFCVSGKNTDGTPRNVKAFPRVSYVEGKECYAEVRGTPMRLKDVRIETIDESDALVYKGDTAGGDSGTPIYQSHGCIGIHQGTWSNTEKTNFASLGFTDGIKKNLHDGFAESKHRVNDYLNCSKCGGDHTILFCPASIFYVPNTSASSPNAVIKENKDDEVSIMNHQLCGLCGANDHIDLQCKLVPETKSRKSRASRKTSVTSQKLSAASSNKSSKKSKGKGPAKPKGHAPNQLADNAQFRGNHPEPVVVNAKPFDVLGGQGKTGMHPKPGLQRKKKAQYQLRSSNYDGKQFSALLDKQPLKFIVDYDKKKPVLIVCDAVTEMLGYILFPTYKTWVEADKPTIINIKLLKSIAAGTAYPHLTKQFDVGIGAHLGRCLGMKIYPVPHDRQLITKERAEEWGYTDAYHVPSVDNVLRYRFYVEHGMVGDVNFLNNVAYMEVPRTVNRRRFVTNEDGKRIVTTTEEEVIDRPIDRIDKLSKIFNRGLWTDVTYFLELYFWAVESQLLDTKQVPNILSGFSTALWEAFGFYKRGTIPLTNLQEQFRELFYEYAPTIRGIQNPIPEGRSTDSDWISSFDASEPIVETDLPQDPDDMGSEHCSTPFRFSTPDQFVEKHAGSEAPLAVAGIESFLQTVPTLISLLEQLVRSAGDDGCARDPDIKGPGLQALQKLSALSSKAMGKTIAKEEMDKPEKQPPVTWYCEVCDLEMNEVSKDSHLKGAKHHATLRKLEEYVWHCDVCDMDINSPNKELHLNGKRHHSNAMRVAQQQHNFVPESRQDQGNGYGPRKGPQARNPQTRRPQNNYQYRPYTPESTMDFCLKKMQDPQFRLCMTSLMREANIPALSLNSGSTFLDGNAGIPNLAQPTQENVIAGQQRMYEMYQRQNQERNVRPPQSYAMAASTSQGTYART